MGSAVSVPIAHEAIRGDAIKEEEIAEMSLTVAQKSVNLFIKEAIASNLNLTAVREFLQDPLAMQLYHKFVLEKLENDKDALAVIEDLIFLHNDDSTEIEHMERYAPIIVLSTFAKFVESHYFIQWMANKNAAVVSLGVQSDESIIDSIPEEKLPDASTTHVISADENHMVHSTNIVRLPSHDDSEEDIVIVSRSSKDVSEPNSPSHPRTTVYKEAACSYIMELDFAKVMGEDSWLTALIAAVDTLPLAFSVATANPNHHGFPLIYVNKHFEKLTGYLRSEVIGQNCKFMQTHNMNAKQTAEFRENNKQALDRMSASLSLGVPVAVELDNFKKDGTPFRNHLILKPLYDQNNVYRYVFGLQYEILADSDGEQERLLNRHLFRLLPDQVYIEADSSIKSVGHP